MKRFLSIVIRAIIAIAALGFLAMFTFPMLTHIINIGNISGALLSLWVFCVSVKPIHKGIKRLFLKRGFTKLLYRFVNICFIAFAIYGTVVTGAMVYAAVQPPAENATVVVPGAQVRPTGNPSVILRGRINVAEEYLKNHENANAILSGGQGTDEPMSEAECMYEVMLAEGVSPDRLTLEDRSTNTTENLKFSQEIIEEKGLSQDLAIATDGFHQLRVRIIAKQLDLKGSVGAISSDTKFYYLPTYAVREWFALPYQLLFR